MRFVYQSTNGGKLHFLPTQQSQSVDFGFFGFSRSSLGDNPLVKYRLSSQQSKVGSSKQSRQGITIILPDLEIWRLYSQMFVGSSSSVWPILLSKALISASSYSLFSVSTKRKHMVVLKGNRSRYGFRAVSDILSLLGL